MPAMSNEAEAAAWNGPRGEHWVSIQGTLDAMMAEVLDLVLSGADLQPGEAVLDIGCGAGATTISAAHRIGAEGSILGLDISEPLLRHAKLRAHAEGLSNVTFQLGDAQTYPLNASNFDVLISRFGVMFFDEPTVAFRNMGTALRPGGRMFFAAWAAPERNPWFTVPAKATMGRLGKVEAGDPAAPGPMAFRDIGRVVKILRSAGMEDCTGVEAELFLHPPGTLEDVVDLAVSNGPAMRIMTALGGTEVDRAAIVETCRAELAPFAVGGRVRVPASVNLFQARMPG